MGDSDKVVDGRPTSDVRSLAQANELEADDESLPQPQHVSSPRRVRQGARPKVHALRELRRAIGLDRVNNGSGGGNGGRPQTRGECVDGPRPCPYVSCRHHLALSVDPVSGSLRMNFPDVPVWEMAESCSLDVADRGGATLEEVGKLTNVTRERARQLETKGLTMLRAIGALKKSDLER